ncbi:hypothetical protein F5X98DRAFT_387477 [Xylaria grammica]|nr:hypothetical protein F5X98DRAFT_387477 [Xylaria grammica]
MHILLLKLAEENGHEQILGPLQRFSIEGRSYVVPTATEELSDHHILLSMRMLEAVAEGRVAEIVRLVRPGANVNTAYMFHDSKIPSVPIVFAAAKSDELVIDARLRNSAEVDRPDQNGMTVLRTAARNGQLTTVLLLLRWRSHLDY